MCLAWSLKFPLMVNCMNSQISELKQIIHLWKTRFKLNKNWRIFIFFNNMYNTWYYNIRTQLFIMIRLIFLYGYMIKTFKF